MNTRWIAALVVAGLTPALANANTPTDNNPKTRTLLYKPAQETPGLTKAEILARQEAQLAQRKLAALGGAPNAFVQGGVRAGQLSSSGGSLPIVGGDDCSTAVPISGAGSFAFDTTGAVTSGQQQTCGGGCNSDVWFEWTSPMSGTATFSLCGGSSSDTVIAVWAGGGCGTTAIGCNDDACGLQSQMSFPAVSGATYMLQIGGYFSSPGAGTFTMSVATAPPNDDCSTATAISGTGPFNFDNTAASTGPQQGLGCGTGNAYNDVWFDWTCPTTGVATYSGCGFTLDTVCAAYAGAGCPTAGTALACNDDGCGGVGASVFNFACTAGNHYMIQVGVYNPNYFGQGAFTLNVSQPPSNDDCSAAIAISGVGTFNFDNLLGTTGTQGQSEALCGVGSASTVVDHDVWYTWTAPSSGTAIFSTCGGSTINTKIAVYAGSGCPTAGSALACNDNACGTQSTLQFPVTAGSLYTLQLGNAPGATGGTGSFTMSMLQGGGSADDCNAPAAISGIGTFGFDNSGATTGADGQTESLCLAYNTTGINNDIWFAWTPNATGTATFATCGGASVDTKIAAYPGNTCPAAGTALACNDDSCGLQSSIQFPVSAGSTYMLQLGNFPGAAGTVGTFTLDVPGGGGGLSYLCDPGSSGVLACPCANPPSGAGRGCDNSSSTGGASITGAGSNTLSNPTLVFTTAAEKPTATTILLQGSTSAAGGLVFGQGVRCVAGSLKRLYVRAAVGGSVSVPNLGGGDPSIPARSAALGDPISSGQSRWYMAYYRDPIVLGGCSSVATYNSTNTAEVPWL